LVENFTCLDPSTKLIPKDQLNPETVTYWKNLTKFLNEEAREKGIEEADAYLEKVLPELSNFCDYVRKFFDDAVGGKSDGASAEEGTTSNEAAEDSTDDVDINFVGKALIEMTTYFDLSEEVRGPKL